MIIFGITMTAIVVVLTLLLVYSFGVGVLFGAPYLPTMRVQSKTALKLLDLKPGQTLYDLGCGDGRLLKLAAKQGINGVGYEMSPLLVLIAKINSFKYRKQIKIIMANYWQADLSKADAVYVFLLDKYMSKFDKKIKSLNKPIKVASYTFKIPGKKPVASKAGVRLYYY